MFVNWAMGLSCGFLVCWRLSCPPVACCFFCCVFAIVTMSLPLSEARQAMAQTASAFGMVLLDPTRSDIDMQRCALRRHLQDAASALGDSPQAPRASARREHASGPPCRADTRQDVCRTMDEVVRAHGIVGLSHLSSAGLGGPVEHVSVPVPANAGHEVMEMPPVVALHATRQPVDTRQRELRQAIVASVVYSQTSVDDAPAGGVNAQVRECRLDGRCASVFVSEFWSGASRSRRTGHRRGVA